MNFPKAMDEIFMSHEVHVRRKCWPKEVLLTTMSRASPPTPQMFIYGEELYGSGLIPWCPSPEDIQATDWEKS